MIPKIIPEGEAMNEQEKVIGAFFDECAKEGLMASFDEEERTKLEECLTLWNIHPGDRILEPGCGTGRLTAILADLVGQDGAVVACDISHEMIDGARRRNLPHWVRLFHGSVNTIPVPDEYFDVVLCFQVFPHFSDRPRALAEIHRVIRPGGRLWIAHLASRETINKRHRDAKHVIVSHQIPDEREMRELLDAGGFHVEMVDDSPSRFQILAYRL
ncbi:methyltransferase domain-containing protein [bacterium]|nr:methyltransferase domain-containing protein [bacterium]